MLRFFLADYRRNLIKILCLSVGMAIGMLLVAKVYFEQTFDRFLPHSDRIYMVTESSVIQGEYHEYNFTPGAIAPGLKRYVPEVVAATRLTPCLGEVTVIDSEGREFEAEGISLADSCLFDVLQRDIIAGSAREALTADWHVAIPRSLAGRMGGDVVGKTLSTSDFPGKEVIIGAVYEDFPKNSTLDNVIYLSLPTIRHIGYDGRANWVGNDRYTSYVLLNEGAVPGDLRPGIDRMLRENVDEEALEVFHFSIGVRPLVGLYASRSGVRTMNMVLMVLALIILFSAAFNYLLVVIGQMQWRAREMAVRKCYGTGAARIFGMVMAESVAYMLVSAGVAALIVLCLSQECEQVLGASAADLLGTERIWLVEGLVCVVLLVLTGVVPAMMYCRTPVAQAFRAAAHGRRVWKLCLLSVQFVAAGIFFALLLLVGRQYALLSNADMGFDYKDVAVGYIGRIPQGERGKLLDELRKLGCVESVATASHDMMSRGAGNNVWLGDNFENHVNISDLYFANAELFDVLGMRVVQGEVFDADADSTRHQVMVEERFVDLMQTHFGFQGSYIAGESFNITEHMENGNNTYTITGVFGNLKRGGFSTDYADERAGVLFPSSVPLEFMFVRFNCLDDASLAQAQQLTDGLMPDADVTLIPFRKAVDARLTSIRRFGTSVLIGGVAILLIALVGLVGYTSDEVQRRAKEIAIRKVNGESAADILRLLCTDISKLAVPSLLAGSVTAMVLGREWLSQFIEQVPLAPWMMLLAMVPVLLLILLVVGWCGLRVANSNPVDYLRGE